MKREEWIIPLLISLSFTISCGIKISTVHKRKKREKLDDKVSKIIRDDNEMKMMGGIEK